VVVVVVVLERQHSLSLHCDLAHVKVSIFSTLSPVQTVS
jgi:hypothetical protein